MFCLHSLERSEDAIAVCGGEVCAHSFTAGVSSLSVSEKEQRQEAADSHSGATLRQRIFARSSEALES